MGSRTYIASLRDHFAKFAYRDNSQLDGASVVAFRALFGLSLAIATLRFVARGWVDELYIAPSFHFTYFGFDWVRPLPAPLLYACFALLFVASLALAAGFFTRVSAAVVLVAFTYVELLDVATYLNHYYLVSLIAFLFVVLPDDRRLALYVLRFQVGVVYVFAGIAKLDSDWLFRAEPLRTWLQSRSELSPLLDETWVAYFASWAGCAFDLAIVPLLLVRRTRPFAYMAVVAFHLVTGTLFQIGMFPLFMIAFATIFFEPSWPRDLFAKVWKHEPNELRPRNTNKPNTVSSVFAKVWKHEPNELRPRNTNKPNTVPSRFVVAILVAHCVLQVVIPLRHYAYDGDVRWHEQGFRFAWNVMRMEKTGQAAFRVRDPRSGDVYEVRSRDLLTELQAKQMATQPDMIVQLAHHLDALYRARGVADPQVFADVFVSLNGRPSARLIDPTVDLSRVSDGFGPRTFVLPEPSASLVALR